MRFWDRLLRSLFVAAAVGLGWGIRGDFGHSLGAMAPGATLGMAFAFVTGQRSAMKWMPLLGAFGAFFISIGGMMSYGILHGYAQADTFQNYSYGFLTLILQGGAWGGFGGAALGLLLEPERTKAGELFSAAATAFATGWLVYFLVVDCLGFHINPPRSDLSINFTGQMVALFAWMVVYKKWTGLRGLALGYMGFGLGMALGRLAGNAIRLAPIEINHWNVMEVGCGFFGGLIFTFGMLGRKLPDPPEDAGWPAVSRWGILYVMGFIPWLHRLSRIEPAKKLVEWTQGYSRAGIADPQLAESYARYTLWGLNAICVAGFAAAFAWIVLWRKDRFRLAGLPVLCFSLLMLLFQNVNCLYFWEATRDKFVNMHSVFWWLFGFMVLFVVAFEFAWPQRDVLDAPEVSESIPWKRWLTASAAVYAAILCAASFSNGDETMKSANTRFPPWAWTEGPLPGAKAK